MRRGGHSVKAQTAEAVRVEVAEIRVAVERATAGRAVAAAVAVLVPPRQGGGWGEAVDDTIAESRAKLGQVGVAGVKAVSPDHGHGRRDLVDQADQVSAGLQCSVAQVLGHGRLEARALPSSM